MADKRVKLEKNTSPDFHPRNYKLDLRVAYREDVGKIPFFLVRYSYLPALHKEIFVFEVLFLELAGLVQIF